MPVAPHPTLTRLVAGDAGPNPRTWGDVLAWITGGYGIDADHWLTGPGVIIDPIPEASTQTLGRPRSQILHSNAGPTLTRWQRLVAYFRRLDIGTESHLIPTMAGEMVQVIPFNRRADCNARANSWTLPSGLRVHAISYECQDNGAGTLDTTPYTLEQLRAIIATLTAVCVVYGVWCTLPATWDDRGIGWHSLHLEWSIYRGKTCPGAARIRQHPYILNRVADNLAAFAQITGWTCGQGGAQ